MAVKVKDNGADELLALSGQRLGVRVGIIGSKASAQKTGPATGNTVAEIASIHEFGLGVPRRSFIRDYVDENEVTIRKWERAAGVNIMKGKWGTEQAMELLGLQLVDDIKEWFNTLRPLAEETIRRKGSSKPLVNTGQLKSSITHEVDK